MHLLMQRTLMAYRPLYLNGLLLDGRCKLPRPNPPDAVGMSRARQRTVLAALVHVVLPHRSK